VNAKVLLLPNSFVKSVLHWLLVPVFVESLPNFCVSCVFSSLFWLLSLILLDCLLYINQDCLSWQETSSLSHLWQHEIHTHVKVPYYWSICHKKCCDNTKSKHNESRGRCYFLVPTWNTSWFLRWRDCPCFYVWLERTHRLRRYRFWERHPDWCLEVTEEVFLLFVLLFHTIYDEKRDEKFM
jgi:hypothetical protein